MVTSRRQRLHLFLSGEIRAPRELSEEEPLFSTGVLDSMNLVRLMAFLEDEFGVNVLPSEVSPDHFDSVIALDHYLARKLDPEER